MAGRGIGPLIHLNRENTSTLDTYVDSSTLRTRRSRGGNRGYRKYEESDTPMESPNSNSLNASTIRDGVFRNGVFATTQSRPQICHPAFGFVPESQFRKPHLSIETGIRPSISPATRWRGHRADQTAGKKEFRHADDRLVINLFGSHSTPPSPSQFANQ